MKQPVGRITPLLFALGTLLPATQAFAQYGSTDDGAVLGALCSLYACIGIFGLLSLVFWIWMLVDLIQRQEYEFPNSKGNSKTTWIIIMAVSWFIGAALIAAIVYYFMVYKKIPRGAIAPPGQAGGYAPPPPPAAPAPPAPPEAPSE